MVATLAVGAAVAASLPVTAAPQAATAEYVFDWPRQPLHEALQQYGELTGDSVLYDTGQAAGKTAPALAGRYTAREALTRLLAGTGLQAHYTAPQALVLMPRLRTPPAPSQPATPADRQQYYGRLQSRVLAALCARPALRVGDYRVALRINVSPVHTLSDVKVHATNRPDMEPAIRDALSGLPIGAPPPGFGLPATLLITPEAARRYGGCAP